MPGCPFRRADVGATLVVALDHGRALRVLGVSRRRFVADVLRLFRPMAASVFGRRMIPGGLAAGREQAMTGPPRRSGHRD